MKSIKVQYEWEEILENIKNLIIMRATSTNSEEKKKIEKDMREAIRILVESIELHFFTPNIFSVLVVVFATLKWIGIFPYGWWIVFSPYCFYFVLHFVACLLLKHSFFRE